MMYQGPGTGYNYRVYQRNDIDWNLVRKNPKGSNFFIGKTNLDAAKAGLAPELVDGSFVQLHHIGQNGTGPLVEASTRIHSFENSMSFRAIHNQFGGTKSTISPVTHGSIWNADRTNYWKLRAENVK